MTTQTTKTTKITKTPDGLAELYVPLTGLVRDGWLVQIQWPGGDEPGWIMTPKWRDASPYERTVAILRSLGWPQ